MYHEMDTYFLRSLKSIQYFLYMRRDDATVDEKIKVLVYGCFYISETLAVTLFRDPTVAVILKFFPKAGYGTVCMWCMLEKIYKQRRNLTNGREEKLEQKSLCGFGTIFKITGTCFQSNKQKLYIYISL
jgi:hypothetical protein